MERDDKFAELIRAAAVDVRGADVVGGGVAGTGAGRVADTGVGAAQYPTPGPDFERRVMVEVARRAIERSRRRARRGMVASLSGLAMLLAGSIAALVVWYPALLPAFTDMSWLEKVRVPVPEFFSGAAAGAGAGAVEGGAVFGFFEQWGGLVLLVLLVGGVAGFIYYLNSLFSSDYTAD